MAKCTGLELGAMEASKPNWAITASGAYGRWGSLVFSPPKNPTKPGTGVLRGQEVATGVYVWQLTGDAEYLGEGRTWREKGDATTVP